jgi:hypothetical protein
MQGRLISSFRRVRLIPAEAAAAAIAAAGLAPVFSIGARDERNRSSVSRFFGKKKVKIGALSGLVLKVRFNGSTLLEAGAGPAAVREGLQKINISDPLVGDSLELRIAGVEFVLFDR